MNRRVVLEEGSKPIRHAELVYLDRAERHRRFECVRYDNCLNYAGANFWDGFSCEACPVRENRERPQLPTRRTNELIALIPHFLGL